MASVVGDMLGDAVSQLLTTIIFVNKKPGKFRSKLTQLQETISRIQPIFNEVEKLNQVFDQRREETDLFINQLKEAENLVLKSEHTNWLSFLKRHHYLSKLDDVNAKLLRFFQNYVQLQIVKNMQKITEIRGSSGVPLLKGVGKELVLVAEDGQEITERGSWSGVPLLKGDVIGFDDQLRDLKTMVLNYSAVDDCSVVVVSAAGGCGKTTLVTKLCHDPQIQAPVGVQIVSPLANVTKPTNLKFGRNIYFATISQTPNIKVVVRNLLQKGRGSQQLDFSSDEDATCQWGSYLGENRSEVLLVLDDVWSASIVMMFKFKLPTYKILVTSRRTFKQFNTYELQPLNDQDATNLFRHSAFSVHGSKHTNVPDVLVTEMVKCCKKHPLALCVIGGLLKEANVASWIHMLKKLSGGKQSVLDLDKSIQLSLERSLDVLEEEPAIKQCYLDLGLFPEDQKIATTKLMDMWIHLYKHDEEGLDTVFMVFELASRHLATLLQPRKRLPLIANFCEEQFVMQHSVMGMVAIHLNSKGPVEKRERLIIKADEPDGQVLPQLPHIVNARLLSIFTDERFSMTWNDYQSPKVEVLLLNFTSAVYILPQFIQSMRRLKVLFITNYGQYSSHLGNFPAPQHLSGLTSIRLELISVSSISTSILELVNLRKLSLIMCKIGSGFEECIINGISNKLPSLLEIEMDYCDDLLTFPAMLCNLVRLKKLSITNCFELISLSEEFGSLRNLEVLRLASCSNLRALPESVGKLQKLSTIDLFGCLSLHELPVQIGELGSLQRLDMTGCSGLHDLPQSVNNLHQLEVVCDEEISYLWSSHTNVKVELVEEDRLSTLKKMITSGIQEFHPDSEPNREVIDRQFLSRDKTKSFYDLMQLDYVQQADVLTRMKDFLHLIWFYPVNKEAEVNFGSLVDKFSLLNKYIRKSLDPSRTRNYLMEIQTLLQDIEEHLDDAASDIVAYLPEGLLKNRSGNVEFENLATGADSGQVLSAYSWSDIPEIHANVIASASRRALSCIMDLKFKKLGISGDGAEDVAEILKNMPELRTFDMDLCVRVTYKHHSIEELMNTIEEEILLWKKRSSETGNEIDVPDESLNCLLFIDYGNNLIDLHEVEFRMSKRYRTVQDSDDKQTAKCSFPSGFRDQNAGSSSTMDLIL
ncbi:hypothetical protein OSB04_016557 [Centaurea solstitialis]|uniref:RPW8 domain-containing protein n=1 Tax=Centaurea solstitialis TaxID=347529 RepID=A0AA38W9X2_9ASTR|nr:hypothetical protein OSB04_016557 [Centaurea solstitialis]